MESIEITHVLKKNLSKGVLQVVCMLVLIVNVCAQKLPDLQQGSLRSPANVKIDGKADEWNNQFQAYNKVTGIFYVIANDDENLYFTLQVAEPNIIDAIVGYGFKLDIQQSNKKNEPNKITVNYPAIIGNGNPLNFGTRVTGLPDTTTNIVNALMNSNNKTLEKKLKWIVVNGIPGIDTLSVYNDTGIKAAGRFDTKRLYTFEIAIPIKYLKNIPSTFSYHMTINGFKPRPGISDTDFDIPKNIPPEAIQAYVEAGQKAIYELNLRMFRKYANTDFWGEYTLVKN